MSSKGFIELLRLNERGKRRKLGQDAQAKNNWSGVAFRLGNVDLVAPLGEVSEVVSPMQMTMMPKSQVWLKGLINLRGRLLPITDLTEFIGLNTSGAQEGLRKIIVVDHDETYGGLLVDHVYGIMHFSEGNFSGIQPNVDDRLDGYLRGSFTQEDDSRKDEQHSWHVFLISQLIEDKRYMDAAV